MYCFDPRHYITTPWGNPKTGNFRAQFLLESILDLKQNLRNIGSDLLIKFGKPEEILPGAAPRPSSVNVQKGQQSEVGARLIFPILPFSSSILRNDEQFLGD